jgi:hypothetical protein
MSLAYFVGILLGIVSECVHFLLAERSVVVEVDLDAYG